MVKQIVSVLVACVLFLGAWKMSEHGLWERRTGAASLSWPSVEGSVVSSGFQTHGRATNSTTSVDIQYRYSVGAGDYEHDRVRFGAHGSGLGAGQWGHLGNLAPGESLEVFYDPQDPQQATLEVGPTGRSLGLIAAAGVIALFGAMLLWMGCVAPRMRPS